MEHDCNIVVQPGNIDKTWCVYEHYHMGDGSNPPIVVYVGAEKLTDIFFFRQGRRNSEWHSLYGSGEANLLVRIIKTFDHQLDAQNFCIDHLRRYQPIPQCNLKGYNLTRTTRAILCSNGQQYDSQADAARKLDINQSSISKHLLNGKPKTINGYSFKYSDI